MRLRHACRVVVLAFVAGAMASISAQSNAATAAGKNVSTKDLERQFFAALRAGDAEKLLAFIPKGGVNVGSAPDHMSRADIEEQFKARRGLYCKLFETSCIDTAINLGNSQRVCSDRELLTRSSTVRTASSEVTRNGVQQAVLVAEMKNDRCSNAGLVDFIFNLDADGWKLFSIP